jgi:hypothetical protein
MAARGCPGLAELFDEATTPHIAHPPRTHHRDFYVATDGSDRDGDGGLGVVVETRDGRRVTRVARRNTVPDNNVAEYRALHLGLDVLARHAPRDASIGVLVDHDALAANVNAAALAARSVRAGGDAEPPHAISVPTDGRHHWRGVRARIAGFGDLRAATIDGRANPAHPLANTPDRYAHVNREPDRCLRPAPHVGGPEPRAGSGGCAAADGTTLPPSRYPGD